MYVTLFYIMQSFCIDSAVLLRIHYLLNIAVVSVMVMFENC